MSKTRLEINQDHKKYLIILIKELDSNFDISNFNSNKKVKIENYIQNLSQQNQLEVLNKFVEKYPEFEIERDKLVESKTTGRFNFFFNIFSSLF